MTDHRWELRVASSVERQLARLPERIAAAVIEFLLGPLSENPRQVGHPLQRELPGLWSARRGAYRILYEIVDDSQLINVVGVEHRSDVYRPR